MWFWFALIALLCWSGSDLFSKIGCQNAEDRLSHLKMVIAVGLVMGIHAGYEIFVSRVPLNGSILLRYLPVSMLYILSMTIGYLGLRYIELSISSPVCNSSGAVVAILSIVAFGISPDFPPLSLVAVGLVCAGVIFLGIIEAREDEEMRAASDRRYTRSFLALAIPIIYCLLDALGTFADSLVLENMNPDSANAAYELTFFAAGAVCAVYVFAVKKEKINFRLAVPRLSGAVFETVGQFFYIRALADTEHVALAAPMISAYCVVSVLWGRLFLKEKLSGRHYGAIALVVLGIIILGVFDI